MTARKALEYSIYLSISTWSILSTYLTITGEFYLQSIYTWSILTTYLSIPKVFYLPIQVYLGAGDDRQESSGVF